MQKLVGGLGFVLTLMGLSGAIDHVWTQPVMSTFLNVVNRQVIPRIGALEGYELYANLGLAVVGVVTMLLSDRLPEDE